MLIAEFQASAPLRNSMHAGTLLSAQQVADSTTSSPFIKAPAKRKADTSRAQPAAKKRVAFHTASSSALDATCEPAQSRLPARLGPVLSARFSHLCTEGGGAVLPHSLSIDRPQAQATQWTQSTTALASAGQSEDRNTQGSDAHLTVTAGHRWDSPHLCNSGKSKPS